ncbi:MAG: 30S ribosomal protein S20 [Parcubacteria group bacterium GW2011_GWA2_43_11]|nr:MAG: 30S ribosomal protein S20 [Parcubacteria group bacterium GW2011_GWA2_43_11]
MRACVLSKLWYSLCTMPIIKSAKKADKASKRKHVFNLRRTRDMKMVVKEVKELVAKGNASEAEKKLPEAYKAIDKAAKNGVIKKNTANRKKSLLARTLLKKVEKKVTKKSKAAEVKAE